jgi:hypothetical protein
VVELKLWYGDVAHEDAFEQMARYLESKGKDVGYMLTFDFRKTKNVGKPQIGWVEHNGKRILVYIAKASFGSETKILRVVSTQRE